MTRYLLLALGLAAALTAQAQPANTNNVPVPFITVAMQTNVVTQVQPLVLTAAQMNLVISNLQAVGISGNVPITAANLQRVMVVQRGSGTFVVTMAVSGGSQTPPPLVAPSTNGAPFIMATTQTNVVVLVQPLVLTPTQMNLVIGSLQAIGISCNVPISAAILQRVVVLQRGDGSFLVTMQLLGQ